MKTKGFLKIKHVFLWSNILVFFLAGMCSIVFINLYMRKQALSEARSKALALLNHHLAIHTYFSQQLKPKLFEWTEPFRSDEYFEPTWMSSTYAVREIEKYTGTFNEEALYYKEAAINARSPENEADEHEKAFLQRLNIDPQLIDESGIIMIDEEPHYVILRRGEAMEESCLRCHSTPDNAPQALVEYYDPTRSFHRSLDEVIQAISIRIPLTKAYANANRFSLRLSVILVIILAGMCLIQFFLSEYFIFKPLESIRETSGKIASGDMKIGAHIRMPYWQEWRDVASAFNSMSDSIRTQVDNLEQRIEEKTAELRAANEQLQQDIARRQQAEERLEQERQQLFAVFDTIPIFIYLQAPDYSIPFVNRTFREIFDEPGERPCYEIIHGRQEPCVECPTFRVFETKKPEVWEWTNQANQTFMIYDDLFLSADGQELVLEVAIDITERKQVEEELKKANADLQRSNRELEQFAYVASHDLQEPLRMVASYTGLLEKQYKNQLDEKANSYIHYAVDGATRMHALIDDLLTYGRVSTQAEPLQHAESQDILNNALADLKETIQESGALVTHADLPEVNVDVLQLERVFQNLLGNAIKFQGETPPRIHVSAKSHGNEWLFCVQDNGIGIESQHKDKIFVIFQRLHSRRDYPGTGIGLAICKRIINRHGGEIWVESAPGKGAAFYFTLPKVM